MVFALVMDFKNEETLTGHIRIVTLGHDQQVYTLAQNDSNEGEN